MDRNIFISFSHKDKPYRDELVPALEAVAAIRDRVWFDQKCIDIGDRFHPEIQQALAESKIGILLVSNHFLTSEYIKTHELPLLLRQAERGALKLGILYVSSVAKAALSVPIEIDGQSRTVNLADTIGINSPAEPLDLIKDRGDRNALYACTADWVVRQVAPEHGEQRGEQVAPARQRVASAPPHATLPDSKKINSADAKETGRMPLKSLPGPIRIMLCRRLGEDWADLAVYFRIPQDRQRGFTRGRERHDILVWLEERDELYRLTEGLHGIGRPDLVELLNQAP